MRGCSAGAAVAGAWWCAVVQRCTGLLTSLGRPFALHRTLDPSLLDPTPPRLGHIPRVEHAQLPEPLHGFCRYVCIGMIDRYR